MCHGDHREHRDETNEYHPHPNLPPEGEGGFHMLANIILPSPSGGGAPKRGAGAPILGMRPWRRTEARELSRRCIPLRGRIHRPKPTEPALPSAGAGRGWFSTTAPSHIVTGS